MAATDELTKLIDNLVEQKTFGLDALGPIKDLRDRAAKQEAALKESSDRIGKLEALGYQKDNKIKLLESDVRDWAQRQAEIENRERKVFELEKASAVAVAQSGVWSDAFHTIFKNTITRESINRSSPIAVNSSGGGSYVSNYETKENVVRETE